MTSIASSAPPGGRGAPPGGEEPPGGRSAPGGRPPRLSIGRQGGKLRRPRLPGTLGGRLGPGQKQVVKTTVKPARASLRDEIGKYIKQRPDLSSASTDTQDAYTAKRGLGKGSRGPGRGRKKEAGLSGQDIREAHQEDLADTEAELRRTNKERAEKTAQEDPVSQLALIEQEEKKTRGPEPRQYVNPPMEPGETDEQYAEKYRQFIEDYAAKAKAQEDPSRPVFGLKPERIEGETAGQYETRHREAVREYLKNHKLGSPGHQTVLGKQENILEARERVRAERQELDPSMLPPELGGIGLKGKIVEADPGSGAKE